MVDDKSIKKLIEAEVFKMAIFSVYDYDRRIFDYYSAPGSHQGLGTVKFSSFRPVSKMDGQTGLGSPPESVAEKLPSNAILVGSGDMPKGVISTKSSGLLGSFIPTGARDVGEIIIVGASLVALWKFWKEKQKGKKK